MLIAFLIAAKSFSQDCEKSIFTQKGASIQTTEYGAEKEIKNVTAVIVKSVKNTSGETVSQLQSIKTQDGTVIEDKTLTYICSSEKAVWGLGVEDVKTKKEAVVAYPKNMAQGQDLKTNAAIAFQQTNEKGEKVKLNMKISNRKVSGSETISVKAGTWKCTKITYDFELKLKLGFIGIPIQAKVTEWYNPEVGVVRTETRTKDKLEGYTEITAVKNGR